MNTEAFEYLKVYKKNISKVPNDIREKGWESKSPKEAFGEIPFKDINLSDKRLTRNQLLKIVFDVKKQNKVLTKDIINLIIEILSWGGVRKDKAKVILDHIEPVEHICNDLFINKISDIEAYNRFYDAIDCKTIKELGPAYYTKLIFYFGKQTGLIMDQWTARSINLLAGRHIIALSTKTKNRCRVLQENNEKVYQEFLEFCDFLRMELQLNSLNFTEELIFSCSPDKASVKKKLGQYHEVCSSWRKYVIENT